MDPSSSEKAGNQTFMVLVQPSKHDSWLQVRQNAVKESKGQESGHQAVPCEVGLDLEACQVNEFCEAPNGRSRSGICVCKAGFERHPLTDKCIEGT